MDLSLFMSRYMNSCKKSINSLYLELKDKGVIVSRRAFYNYCNGVTVPELEKLKTIFNALNIEYSDEILNRLINNSVGTGTLDNDGFIRKTISLRLSSLSDRAMSDRVIMGLIDRRVEQTASNFSDYISKLIKEDIEKGILERK